MTQDKLVKYNKTNNKDFGFRLTIFFYALSILSFIFYLVLEYNTNIEVNYFIRLLIIIIASIFLILGNNIHKNYNKKINDKKYVSKFSHIIVFIYYTVLLINMVFLARYNVVDNYNLIPFKTIIDILKNGTI